MADPDYVGFAHQVLADGTSARQNAYTFDQQQRTNLAKQIAGQRVANGDYAGAAAVLGGAGDVQDASALTQQSIGQQGLEAASRGDVVSARAIGAQSGSPETYSKLSDTALAGAQQRAAGIANLTQFLSKLPSAPGDAQGDPSTPRGQALRQLASSGAGAQYGISGEALQAALQGPLDDGHLAQVQQSLRIPYSGTLKEGDRVYQYGQEVANADKPVALNPDQRLVSAGGAPLAGAAPLPVKTAPGEQLRNPTTGAPVGGQTPYKNEVVPYTAEQGISVVNPNPGGASPSPASVGVSPINGAGGHNGPGHGAQNNPYNLHSPANGGMWNGETGVNPNGTGNFATPAAADRAFGQVLNAYARRGVSTPDAFVETYASTSPPDQKATYKAALQRAVGSSFNLADPAVQVAVKNVVLAQEGNNTSGQVAQAQAGSGGLPTPQGYRPGSFNGVQGQYDGKGQFHPVSGEISPVDSARLTSERIQQLRGNPQVQEAQNSLTAYRALTSIASQSPGGMQAYTLLDTFARAINPGAVARLGTIEAIKESQGISDELKGKLLALQGKGFLDQRSVQGLLDTVSPIVQAHWDQVNGLNQQNASWAKANNLDPSQVTMNIGARPTRFVLGSKGPNNAGGSAPGPAPLMRQQAQQALARGADRGKVLSRLRGWGIDTSGL